MSRLPPRRPSGARRPRLRRDDRPHVLVGLGEAAHDLLPAQLGQTALTAAHFVVQLVQPLRRACEQLLVTRDWGEAFAAGNPAIKPYSLFRWLEETRRRRVEAYLVKLTSRCLPEANKRGILIG
jgi:hypothetical protein